MTPKSPPITISLSLTYQKPSSFCMDLKNSLCSAYLWVERKCRLEEKI